MDQLPSIYAPQGQYVPSVASAGTTALDAKARTDAAKAQDIKDKTTFGDLIGAKVVQGPIAWADRFLQEQGVPRDPNFYGAALDPYIEQWRKDGLEGQLDLIERAQSPAHLDLLKGFAVQNKMAAEDSAQFGMVANAAAGLLDPSMFAIGAASGGLGYSATAGRLANAVRAGIVGAATNVGTEALSSQYDPNIDTSHLVTAGAFGFITGGAFGFRGPEQAELVKAANKIVKGSTEVPKVNTADSMGSARVPGSVVSKLDGPDVNTPEWEQKIIDEAYQNAHIKAAFTGSRGEPSKGVLGWLKGLSIRRDIAGRLRGSNSAVVRNEAAKLVRDSVGNTDRSIATKFTASEEANLLDEQMHGAYRRSVETEWAKFSKDSGLRGDVARKEFNETVGYHIRGVAKDVAPEVEATAQHVKTAFKDMADELRARGVPGFEQEFNGDGYLPRIFSARGYTDLNATKGLSFENLLENLVKPAMRSAWLKNLKPGEEIDDDLLHEVGKAWLKRGYEKAMGGPTEIHGQLAAADAVTVRQLLEEAGVATSRVDALVGKLEKQNAERSLHSRAKSRIDIDESFGATLKDDLGNEHKVHLADLLENNVDNLVPDYLREMSGWAALKKHADIGTPAELERYRSLLLKHGKEAGDGDHSRMLDIVFNSILGHSTSDAPHSAWTRASRLIRSQNFLTSMGQVGFTMVEGVGGTLGAVGLRNAIKAAPAALDMVRKMRMGNFSTEEAAWLADVTGLGTDFVRNQPYLRLDAIGETVWNPDTAVGRSLNAADCWRRVKTDHQRGVLPVQI